MLQGIALLTADPGTDVIAIVSKPPAPAVAQQVMEALEAAGKPAVVLFLGSGLQSPSPRIAVAHTLVDCAALAVAKAASASSPKASQADKSAPISGAARGQLSWPRASATYEIPKRPRFAPSQRHLRALFSGGTYASEAQILWAKAGLEVWSNVPLQAQWELPNPRKASRGHTALDLGDDAFTVGRPHPMIDQAARLERLLQEAADPTVRVVLMDVVIGWGAHADPAQELAAAIVKAKTVARQAGRNLAVLGFVCGTEEDPQRLSAQEGHLRQAGMVLAPNSASAAWLAGEWVK
jgi:succinyl-CoA synthetase alpha subunit